MYQEYFGFRALPFASAPDPHFFYANPVYQAALATLQYGILSKKGVIVLTGPVGTGKTALLLKLFDDLGPSVKPVWLVNSGVSITNLLSTILAELELKPRGTDRAAMIDAFHGYLLESASRENITCLVVEEADNLDGETLEGLRQLCNFEAHGEKLVQLILVGRPGFLKKLDEPGQHSLKQRVALHCRLFALTRGELDRYVEFQLRAADYQGANLFSPGAIARIAHYSGGIPRLVNIVCDNALLTAYRNSKGEISPTLIDEVAKDMGLASDQQAGAAVATDSASRNSRIERPPQAPRQAANWDFVSLRPTARAAAAALPRWRATKAFSAALLVLIPLGGAGWAVYFKESMPFLEFLKGQSTLADSDSARGTTTAEEELARPISLEQQAAVADPNDALFERNQTNPPAAPQTTIPPAVQEPVLVAQGLERQGKDDGEARSTDNAAVTYRLVLDPAAKRRLLETDVRKAIENRAIEGVAVSFINGTVYLDGQVASERQRSLAERAALSVTDVVKVNNRLAVER
jgi:general secretion pathway protein A